MTLPELQKQALQLSISDRWRLVESVLRSIQQETLSSTSPIASVEAFTDLNPWTQSLIGAIQIPTENSTESYLDYLEEKYR